MYYSVKVVIMGKFIQVIQLPTLKESKTYINENYPNQSYKIDKFKRLVYSSDKLIKTYVS